MNIGAHPALSFRTMPVAIDGTSRDVILVRRYLAGELSPTYALSKSASAGMYYLYSRGIGNDITRNTHFVAARASVDVPLYQGYSIRVAPQAYYLRMDDRDGYYLASTLTVGRRNLPLSLSTMASRPLRTRISQGKEFLWNVSVNYAID